MEWSLNTTLKKRMKQAVMFIGMCMSIWTLTFLFACNNQAANKKLEFYYYPDKNIYYDVANKTYLYSLDGAKTWGEVPGDLKESSLGEKKIIYTTTDSVWKDNEAHRKMYAGTLFNVVKEDADTTSAGPEIKERKVVKKSAPKVAKTEQKKKKQPVRDFFKKVFGKKKDNKN